MYLVEQARYGSKGGPGPGEIRSWARSLPALLTDLIEAGLGSVDVLIEQPLPFSPKRADVILCGMHPRTRRPSYVLIELKQWTEAITAGGDRVHVPYLGDEPVLHPVEQVRRYCQQLVNFTPALAEQPDAVHGAAYLHNATDAQMWNIRHYPVNAYGQMFTQSTKASMMEWLRTRIDPDAPAEACRAAGEHLLTADLAPSKPLLSVAAKEIRERQQFILLDEQQVAYTTVRLAVEKSHASRRQTVVIVIGGPGSGKSVIALSLLGELSRQQHRVMHATGSSAFTSTMRKVVGSRRRQVQDMFTYFNNFTEATPRSLDVIICDEAHRLRINSANRYTKPEVRAKATRLQVEELIDVAHVPVFLLDENQVVRPGEMGSVEAISAAAKKLGCDVETVHLKGQYRCGGSEFYDTWVNQLLGISSEPAQPWSTLVTRTDEQFSVHAASTPAALEAWLVKQQATLGGTARIAAGYSWPWSDPVDRNGHKQLVDDVTIGDWARPWNVKPAKRVPDAPESYFWATDERGFGQVGCIYTAQGFEYDWAGVIFGPDFVRRRDTWVARPEHNKDRPVKASRDGFHALVRNTYNVLLTRGMRGVILHSTDPETQAYFERMTA